MENPRKTVAIIGAGIVGVSTAIWCLRDGHDVILIDRKGPAEGASHGNGGVLASNGIVPISVPGLLRNVPGLLFGRDQPLFLKWQYLPRLVPWLTRFLGHANASDVRKRASAMTRLVGDSLAEHQDLARGTGAEKWICPADYVFLYRDRAHFEGDSFGWQIRADHGYTWQELEGTALRDYDPAFGPSIGFGARCPEPWTDQRSRSLREGSCKACGKPGCAAPDRRGHGCGSREWPGHGPSRRRRDGRV